MKPNLVKKYLLDAWSLKQTLLNLKNRKVIRLSNFRASASERFFCNAARQRLTHRTHRPA